MSYIVKRSAKHSRPSKKSLYGPKVKLQKPSRVWSFDTEAGAIVFAKEFGVCWVEVWHKGEVIFRNFSLEKPKWVSEAEGLVIREQNKQAQIYLQQKDSEKQRQAK